MCIHRGIDRVVHLVCGPRPIRTFVIDERDRKLVAICQCTRDLLAAWQRDSHGAFGISRIEHALFQLQTLVASGYSGKITGWRMAFGATARAVEILLASLCSAGLKIADIHAAPAALHDTGGGNAGANERNQR